MDPIIAGVVLTLAGALVTFGMHRLEKHLERQDVEAKTRDDRIDKALNQYASDIGAIARKLRMRRREDGVLR